ncbi:MAG: tol-pal system protein YbgF [Candidatus Aminicenantes bacterium]|nr:tol-pal system protein YbgF [Candidatus Aminicenantes bacterium]
MGKTIWGIFLLFSLSLAVPGSNTDKKEKAYELIYKDIQLLKQNLFQMDKKIEQNREEIKTIKTMLSEMLSLLRLLQENQTDLQNEQNKIPAQYQVILEKLQTFELQLAKYAEILTEIRQGIPQVAPVEGSEEETNQTPPDRQTSEASPPAKESELPTVPPGLSDEQLSPLEVYNNAMADYLKGNFALAIEGFKLYLEKFPESPLADNSLFWIGECYFSLKQYPEAITSFNDLILNYPEGDKIPTAYLKKGLSLIELDKRDEAIAVFRLLISKFPYEEDAKIAQEKIKELGY